MFMVIASSGFNSTTIKKVINSMHRKKFLLPAIQREFVWNDEQIIKLFDSLMKDYPIGSFLFWDINEQNISDYRYYEFLRDYHEKDNYHNPKASTITDKNIIVILDGQQRLTALYIGLMGSYAKKIPYKRWDDLDAFPKKNLYLNLLSESPEFDLKYDFQFLTSKESKNRDDKTFWFEIGNVMQFDTEEQIFDFLEKNNIDKPGVTRILHKLWNVITEKNPINFYLETSQDLDKVLNIFIRVNSGGTQLSYSDLLLSIATAKWKTNDAREEIINFVDELNNNGRQFDFNKDFVLKSCLVLSDLINIAFNVKNFNNENMLSIEKKWNKIKEALILAVQLISSFGYDAYSLVSTTAVIPIAYYLLKIGLPKNFHLLPKFESERNKVKKWLTLSLIKRTFSGTPDNVLLPIRRIISNNDKEDFPLDQIIEHLNRTNRALKFTKEEMEGLLDYKYNQKHTFAIMTLLYPNFDYQNLFQKDHIFPKDLFKRRELKKKGFSDEKINFYINNYNYLGNLQLLPGPHNASKKNKEFDKWLKLTYKTKEELDNFMNTHFIPKDISLDFANFEEFLEKREELILARLKKVLTI